MRFVPGCLSVFVALASYNCSPQTEQASRAGSSAVPQLQAGLGAAATGNPSATAGVMGLITNPPLNQAGTFAQAGVSATGASGKPGLPMAGVSAPRAGAGPSMGGRGGSGAVGGKPLDPSVKQPAPDKLPQVKGTCPNLADGTVSVAGSSVVIWVGSKPGPAYFYFHGTGTSPSEVDQGLPGATAGVRTNGGLVASWDGSNSQGTNTGTIWYTGDLDAMDQLVACGIQKGIIDTGRIHVSGYSAGGLETGAAVFSRSNYVASAIVYSGGHPFGGGGLQDPSNVPAIIGAHGAQGSDMLGLDFHDGTIAIEDEIVKLGGFAMDCDDGGDHIGGWIGGRAGVGGQALKFFADHPYNTRPSPYASALPAGYPAYCKIVK